MASFKGPLSFKRFPLKKPLSFPLGALGALWSMQPGTVRAADTTRQQEKASW